MRPIDFMRAMNALANNPNYDPECAHYEADKLMCNLLRLLGYEDGVIVFEGMQKWYA